MLSCIIVLKLKIELHIVLLIFSCVKLSLCTGVCSENGTSQMQRRSLLGVVLMSTPDLGDPTHYIPTFYQQSTFITLQRDAIVSKLPM